MSVTMSRPDQRSGMDVPTRLRLVEVDLDRNDEHDEKMAEAMAKGFRELDQKMEEGFKAANARIGKLTATALSLLVTLSGACILMALSLVGS